MVEKMTHLQRGMAALNDEPVDRLCSYPLAMGVNRNLLPGHVTYPEWANNPKLFADSFVLAQREYGFDFAIGLMDLSVMAADLGSHVRMDPENTPFVDDHVLKSAEDLEKMEIPDWKNGRCGKLIEGTKLFAEALKDEVITAGFIEGPLLALSQSRGAEYLFMDMFEAPEAVHKAVQVCSDFDSELIKAFGETGVAGLTWDCLWASYSCLGDEEYDTFEGQYMDKLNQEIADNGMAMAIHSCADLPHLDYQIKKWKPAIYSLAYYPLIPGSRSPTELIEQGYADNTLLAGVIDPQLFIRGTPEQMDGVVKDLCQEVKTALCNKGLNSRWVISSNCEVPPDEVTKKECIKAAVDATVKYGTF